MRKTRGAISIFLVIIMLPMMTMAGVFVDMARVEMAKEVVTTSADLALNTTLSNYDKNLKDYFGLLASCQNNADVIAVSKRYFQDNMVSAGVSNSAAQEYVDNVFDAFLGDEDIVDMLQISVNGEVGITPTANGAMNNPAMLKKGIVEFMKYRAPVNGVVDLFQKIADSSVSDRVEDASKEAEMTKAKKKFYEAEEDLIKQAEIAYEAIKKYNSYTTFTGSNISEEKFMNDFSSFLASPEKSDKTMEQIFRIAHEKMVKNLYNTHDSQGTTSVTVIKKKSITNPGTISTYSSSSKASAGDIENLLKAFNTALKEYKSANSSLNTAWEKVGKKLGSDYAIQYWVALTNECSSAYSTYATKASNLWKAAEKLQNAIDHAAKDAMSTKIKKSDVSNSDVTYGTPDNNGKLTLSSLCDSFFNYYNSGAKGAVTGGGSTAFKNVGSQIDTVNTDANKNAMKLTTVENIYNLRNTLNKYKTALSTAYGYAKTAKDETNKLKKKLEDYKKAFLAWQKAANDAELDSSDLAATDREEIKQLEKDGIEKFSQDSVTDLTERMGNIYTLHKSLHDDVAGIKYKNTKVVDISDYKKFRSAASLNSSKIVRTNDALNTYATESFSFTIGNAIQRIEIRDNRTSETLIVNDAYVITDSFHPNVEKTSLELYNWMKTKFEGAPAVDSFNTELTGEVNDKSSAKEAKKTVSNKSEDTNGASTTENTTGKSFSEWKSWGGADLPSKEFKVEEKTLSAKLDDVSTYVTDLFTNFPDTFMGSLANMRDDLFVLDYIFSMFTHDTFDNEGCYDKLSDADKKGLDPVEAPTKYNSVKEAWTGSNENKTLTLTPRNSKNNWAYGGEVEYILYGNASNAANKATAYAGIYAIRYALDLPAVFMEYWDDYTLNAFANALQALAYIPAPLTVTLVCLAITAAEAAVDLSYLRAGIPVMLVKIEPDDLYCNVATILDGAGNSTTDITDKITLQYSDYLKLFLYVKLIGYGENDVYQRTADVIQANVALSSGNKQYSLGKAQVYYDLKADVQVAPMWSRLLAIDELGDVASATGWRSISINMTRGY